MPHSEENGSGSRDNARSGDFLDSLRNETERSESFVPSSSNSQTIENEIQRNTRARLARQGTQYVDVANDNANTTRTPHLPRPPLQRRSGMGSSLEVTSHNDMYDSEIMRDDSRNIPHTSDYGIAVTPGLQVAPVTGNHTQRGSESSAERPSDRAESLETGASLEPIAMRQNGQNDNIFPQEAMTGTRSRSPSEQQIPLHLSHGFMDLTTTRSRNLSLTWQALEAAMMIPERLSPLRSISSQGVQQARSAICLREGVAHIIDVDVREVIRLHRLLRDRYRADLPLLSGVDDFIEDEDYWNAFANYTAGWTAYLGSPEQRRLRQLMYLSEVFARREELSSTTAVLGAVRAQMIRRVEEQASRSSLSPELLEHRSLEDLEGLEMNLMNRQQALEVIQPRPLVENHTHSTSVQTSIPEVRLQEGSASQESSRVPQIISPEGTRTAAREYFDGSRSRQLSPIRRRASQSSSLTPIHNTGSRSTTPTSRPRVRAMNPIEGPPRTAFNAAIQPQVPESSSFAARPTFPIPTVSADLPGPSPDIPTVASSSPGEEIRSGGVYYGSRDTEFHAC